MAKAAERERLTDLLPDALKHRAEVRLFRIKIEVCYWDTCIERIVTAIESLHLRPADFCPGCGQPHNHRDSSKRAMWNQTNEASVCLRGECGFLRVDLRSSQFCQLLSEPGYEVALESSQGSTGMIALEPRQGGTNPSRGGKCRF
jgi:hypothetical protein